MTTTTADVVSPADFGDPTAHDLGEYRGGGSIANAVAWVQRATRMLAGSFPDTFGKVQFFYNETPVVLTPDSAVSDALADWAKRRAAYQRAVGIVG